MTPLDSRTFPWARFYDLSYPVQFDELGDVLEDIRASQGIGKRREPGLSASRLIGDSPQTRELCTLISRVAPSKASVLITGESGTGKEVVARMLHEQSGRRGQFVAINCGAIPDQLLESELFGHERGAFTGADTARAGRFEQATGGTLFLDEIGDMPVPMQVKLLRVLEERSVERVGGGRSRPVDTRVIAATHRDIQQCIDEGGFREDLFYRLNVFPLEVPSLRERPEDIRPLVAEMIQRSESRLGVTIHLTEPAFKALERYSWPGNVRELGNLIERLAVIKPNGVVELEDLPWPVTPLKTEVVSAQLEVATTALPETGVDLKQYLSEVERGAIEAALEQADGVVKAAADALGLRRTTLVEKIRRYRIGD